MTIGKIQPVRVGIVLHSNLLPRSRLKDCVHVELIGIAAQENATRGMSDQRNVSVADSTQQTVGHFGAVLLKM